MNDESELSNYYPRFSLVLTDCLQRTVHIGQPSLGPLGHRLGASHSRRVQLVSRVSRGVGDHSQTLVMNKHDIYIVKDWW